jgi:succinoglycan biosynthesis protein ExoO
MPAQEGSRRFAVTPKVSVVVPAYNAEDYIGACIQSVLEQSFHDFEILVVDDCSTDATMRAVQRFHEDRIRLFENQQNMGPSYSRNRAIDQARGDWLALLDADDWWAAERLEKLLAVAEREAVDMVADDLLVVPDGSRKPINSALSARGLNLQQPTRVSPVTFVDWDLGITQPLIRRAFLADSGVRLDESLRCGVDFDFFLRCFLKGATFVLVPEAYYFYRARPGSITSRRIELFTRNREATRRYLEEDSVRQDPELSAALRRRERHQAHIVAYNRIRMSLRRGSLLEAWSFARQTPGVFLFALRRLPRGLVRRIERR